ncbi:MAG: TetR/AcrR family transcriptional regulator [Gorillibacterium sp.]|nr:TetR/AcrR family transcriptional regulator [Gorillibacterium sp.]
MNKNKDISQDKHEDQLLFSELLKLGTTQKKRTEKQDRILQSAVDVFAEKGYAAASTSEIAERAGVAEGTIFRHYKTKKELLHSIMVPVMLKFIAPASIDDFVKVLETKYESYEDFLRAIITNRLTFARNYLPVIKILLQEIPFQNELRGQFINIAKDKVMGKMVAIIEYYQQRGDIRPLPPLTIIRLTVSVFLGYVFSRLILVPDNSWDDQQEIEQSIAFIMKGLSPNLDG